MTKCPRELVQEIIEHKGELKTGPVSSGGILRLALDWIEMQDQGRTSTSKVGKKVAVWYSPENNPRYPRENWERRRKHSGHHGVITSFSEAHGLCFEVRFSNRDLVWYEPDELEIL